MRLPWKRREQWQERLGRNKTILWEKLREALASVVPITVIVLILSFTVAPIPTETLLAFLIGAVMVAGILTEGRGTPAVARALVRSFEQRCGATICKELKGVATGVPLCPCPECVRNAVLALGDVLPDAVKE